MDFEKAFSDFIDNTEYDEAQSALFKITREAFKAGFKAAQNSPPPKNKILEINATKAECFKIHSALLTYYFMNKI